VRGPRIDFKEKMAEKHEKLQKLPDPYLDITIDPKPWSDLERRP
jgi:hypothetical protein